MVFKVIFNIILVCLLSYFTFHAICGNRGILAYVALKDKIDHSFIKLYQLRARRLALERKIDLLKPNSLDLDMLDEQSRKVLGLARSKEKVFGSRKILNVKN